VDPSTLETASVIELDNNEAAISMCCMRFSAAEGHMLAVGTVQGLGFLPRTADGAHCPSLPHAANHGLCCAVLCCAVLCCAVLCCAVLAFKAGIQGWHDVQQLVVTFECSAGSFSESAASMIISSTSLVSRKYYSWAYLLGSFPCKQAKDPAQLNGSLHFAKAVLLLCRGVCSAL
jgi:hypothetical protein